MVEGRKAKPGQPPLPLYPARALDIGAAAALLEDESGGVFYVWGNATFAWDVADAAGRRFAAVQLVVTKTAKAAQVARAFEVSTSTLFRWRSDFSARGLGGLLGEKRGPKAQRALDKAQIEAVKTMRKEHKSLREIAGILGYSTSPVRQALGLIGKRSVDQDDAVRSRDVSQGQDDSNEACSREPKDEEVRDAVSTPLSPLAQPVPRDIERRLARFTLIDEATPVFTQGAGLPLLGMLLILSALDATGLIDAAREVYKRLKSGFYGLTSVLVTMVFMALAREPRAQGATRIPPHDLGRLLALDRAPEVKTIRRKLSELAAKAAGSELIAAIARARATERPEVLGYLYIDGHVRVYAGEKDLQKAHVTRARIAARATLETWVNDTCGDPVMVVTAEPSASLVKEIRRLLAEIRRLVKDDRRVTIVFDRGGWSPDLFAEMLIAGFDFLTYRKGKVRKEPVSQFNLQSFVDDNHVSHPWNLADRNIRLRLTKKPKSKKILLVRQRVRLSDNGHQTQIVISRMDLPAGEVAYRMFNRWRQENYFRYGRAHFALDGLDSHKGVSDDPNRTTPNPARKAAQVKLHAAQGALQRAKAALGQAVGAIPEKQRPTMGAFKTANAKLTSDIDRRRAEVERLEAEVKATPTRLPLSAVQPQATVLDEERKLVTCAIRMATYNAESALARILATGARFPMDEARSLLREAFNTPGDLQVS